MADWSTQRYWEDVEEGEVIGEVAIPLTVHRLERLTASAPIGISTYELTRALPARLQSALPTVEEIEAELAPKRRKR